MGLHIDHIVNGIECGNEQTVLNFRILNGNNGLSLWHLYFLFVHQVHHLLRIEVGVLRILDILRFLLQVNVQIEDAY